MKMLMTTVALMALATGANAETLRFGYAENATPTVEAMQRFAELVSEKTDGEVTVQFFPDGQLGGERELVELVQGGLLDMTKVSSGLMEGFAPVYGAFSMPYLFDDEDHYYAALDSAEVMDPVYQATTDQGMVGLTYYNSGARSFYTKDKAIETPADLAGLKIRVLQSPTSIRMVEMLGASPIAMSQAEVYTSIQQGILDGAENNEFALTVARHAEVAKAYSYDMHTRIPDVMLASTAMLDRLTPEQQTAIRDAARESTKFHKKAWGAAVDATRAEAESAFGVTFTRPDLAPFQAAVQPMYDDMPEAIAPTVDAIRAMK